MKFSSDRAHAEAQARADMEAGKPEQSCLLDEHLVASGLLDETYLTPRTVEPGGFVSPGDFGRVLHDHHCGCKSCVHERRKSRVVGFALFSLLLAIFLLANVVFRKYYYPPCPHFCASLTLLSVRAIGVFAVTTGGSNQDYAIPQIAGRALDAHSSTSITTTICSLNVRSPYATPSAVSSVETIGAALGTGRGPITGDTSVTTT